MSGDKNETSQEWATHLCNFAFTDRRTTKTKIVKGAQHSASSLVWEYLTER